MTKKIQDSEDCDLFRLTIGAVRSIKNDKVQFSGADKPKPYPKSKPDEIENRFVERNDYGLETVSTEDWLNYIAPGLQKNVLVKMRKGHFGLDAEIDLHGLTSEEAKRKLLFFLHRAVI
ncbi:MAG TPA: DNA mismatch repair protein MutS, partial [Methylomicrobium sp.]|nr:DNA mismatch repair protein MutS [Methylomicrobium sp.]